MSIQPKPSRGRKRQLCGLALLLNLALAGCGPASSSEGKKDSAEEKKNGVHYQEGVGLMFPEETRAALGVKTVEAGESTFQRPVDFPAQVYRVATEPSGEQTRTGFAYASGTVPSAQSKDLTKGAAVQIRTDATSADAPTAGAIYQVDAQRAKMTGLVEVLVEVPDGEHRFSLGTSLNARVLVGAETTGVSVPRSALLAAAEGNFVYVENQGAYLRRPIKIGGTSGDTLEVTEGLKPGERVVTQPVDSLWLMELKEVKGTAGGG